VLFDEIEKAHPDVFNTLLQVLDDGRLTDAQGRVVDFKNTVVIMTSNIGSQYLVDVDEHGVLRPGAREQVLAELRGHFRPEFLNRMDDIVIFHALTAEELEEIVDLMIHDLVGRLSERRISVDVTDGARALIAQRGYDPVYGARPLRRYIQHELETPIARALIRGDLVDGGRVVVDVEREELSLRYSTSASEQRAA
jgi:ATP-dependent Clp protease ATP-binding subunit ClpB